MLPQYTFALGGTHKIKKFIDYLESQEQTLQSLKIKLEKLKSDEQPPI